MAKNFVQCKGYTFTLRGSHYGPGQVEVESEEIAEILSAKVEELDAVNFPEDTQVVESEVEPKESTTNDKPKTDSKVATSKEGPSEKTPEKAQEPAKGPSSATTASETKKAESGADPKKTPKD